MSLVKGTNSYVSVSEADSYLSDRLDVAAWTNAPTEQKSQALITATAYLDGLVWIGTVVSESQSLAFPRVGSYDDPFIGATVYFGNTPPKRITDATIELAYHFLNNDGILDDTGGAESISISGIAIMKPKLANKIPEVVRTKIYPLLKSSQRGNNTWWRAN